MESILTMTKYDGEATDMPNELGQIREGFLADLTEFLIPLQPPWKPLTLVSHQIQILIVVPTSFILIADSCSMGHIRTMPIALFTETDAFPIYSAGHRIGYNVEIFKLSPNSLG